MDTPSTDDGTKRPFSDTAWGKTALLVGVLVIAVLASRSCASRDTEISKERAAEIARKEIAYTPDKVDTRFVPRGFNSRPTWAVSLQELDGAGEIVRVTVVVVDANDGHVIEIRKQR